MIQLTQYFPFIFFYLYYSIPYNSSFQTLYKLFCAYLISVYLAIYYQALRLAVTKKWFENICTLFFINNKMIDLTLHCPIRWCPCCFVYIFVFKRGSFCLRSLSIIYYYLFLFSLFILCPRLRLRLCLSPSPPPPLCLSHSLSLSLLRID